MADPEQKERQHNRHKPQPHLYYSYPQALAILEKRFGATDREIVKWIEDRSENGGLDAYCDVHNFADPPKASLVYLAMTKLDYKSAEPAYRTFPVGKFFLKENVDNFTAPNRYISFDGLKARWLPIYRTDADTVEAIRSSIRQSRLMEEVPGFGFSQLTNGDGFEVPPPEWAMFRRDQIEAIEAQDLAGLVSAEVPIPAENTENSAPAVYADSLHNPTKVIVWTDPDKLVPVDQIPGAIADSIYPKPWLEEWAKVNATATEDEQDRYDFFNQPVHPNPDAITRLLCERKFADQLRRAGIPDNANLSQDDARAFIAKLGFEVEFRVCGTSPDAEQVEATSVSVRLCPEKSPSEKQPEWAPTSTLKDAFRDIWPGDIDAAFSKPRAWLLKHCKYPGTAGMGGDALWDIVGIASDLKEGDSRYRPAVAVSKLNEVFNYPALRKWKAQWEAYLEQDKYYG